MENYIEISGAREHNLKNIEVKIPHGKHTVISGVSGSGKSTLAYDVIYAVGQKRLLDCFSDQTKLFTTQLKQPDINYIKGLTPVISLKQHEPRKNPRATIGTLSEVSSYLRYLYTIIGEANCPFCGKTYPIRTLHHLMKDLEKLEEGTIIELQFPIYKPLHKKDDLFFSELRSKGFKKIIIDGERRDLRDWIKIEKDNVSIFVIADKIQIKKEFTRSDIKAMQNALCMGDGFLRIVILDDKQREKSTWFFDAHGCKEHGMVTADILPAFFSFNDLNSCCLDCQGAGVSKKTYPYTLIQDHKKSLKEGPIFKGIYNMKQPYRYMLMYSLAKHYHIPFDEPFEILSDEAKNLIFYGSKKEKFPLLKPDNYKKQMPNYAPKVGEQVEFEGIVNWVNRYYKERQQAELKDFEVRFFNMFMIDEVCESCHGTRLKPQRAFITINGDTYHDLGNIELNELKDFIDKIEISKDKKDALIPVLNEVKSRLNALIRIGLGYLNLNRRVDTLSGGEHQRIRLAGQIGSDLRGLTYIIDEPTIGLHGMDNLRIIDLLESLCKQGNTVITIEHDMDIIKRAEHIIEMGPGAGVDGGEIIASGTLRQIMHQENSILKSYLKPEMNRTWIRRKQEDTDFIRIVGAKENNLKNIDVTIPLKKLVCLTGVSGSGKSSIAIDILYKAYWHKLHDARVAPGAHDCIEGLDKIKDVYCIDQSQMGRTNRSTPVTFIGVFDKIRSLFARCEEAKELGLDDESYYSFNSKGGCPSCKGKGYIDTHIHYLGDLETPCPICKGEQYIDEVLEVRYKALNIKQILDLDFDAALAFFHEENYIRQKLQYVVDLGLGYMKLGQPTSTISGGEAQRLCLAKEISKMRGSKDMLYIMDEPTTGLHSKDIEKLLIAIRSLIDKGNSMLIIEHNPDVIIHADYIIDIGPLAGKEGGEIVASGTVEEIMSHPNSKTGQYLEMYYNE